jgi:hypothetical protein
MKNRIVVVAALVLLSAFVATPVLAAKYVRPNLPVSCTVKVSDRHITKGEKVILSWNSVNAVFGTGPKGSKLPPFGSVEIAPTQTTLYKFKFLGLGGNKNCGVRVHVS